MRPVFLPSLLHEPTGDPGVWIDVFDENRAILLDLPDLSQVASRKLMRVERALVTHTHMDHFLGFDRLLRLVLGRQRELVLTGPPGFLERLQGKIDAYTWNLIRDYPVRLVGEEVNGDTIRRRAWTGAGEMRPEPLPTRPFDGALHAERLFTIHAALLDHGIPVLGLALRETEHLSVNKDRLVRRGWSPGPWLRDLKHAVRRCLPGQRIVEVPREDGTTEKHPEKTLAEELLIRSPGQRIAYLTDLRWSPENVARAVELARDADVLICECAFLDQDRDLAASRHHLTARQAGEIARSAGAKRLVPFHFSTRYKGRENEVLQEVEEAFGGPILILSNVQDGPRPDSADPDAPPAPVRHEDP